MATWEKTSCRKNLRCLGGHFTGECQGTQKALKHQCVLTQTLKLPQRTHENTRQTILNFRHTYTHTYIHRRCTGTVLFIGGVYNKYRNVSRLNGFNKVSRSLKNLRWKAPALTPKCLLQRGKGERDSAQGGRGEKEEREEINTLLQCMKRIEPGGKKIKKHSILNARACNRRT